LKILLITSMIPQEDGGGAIPVLLHAQLVALLEHNEVTLVSGFGDEAGEEEAAAALAASDSPETHFADRRQPASNAGRWRVRLARSWAFSRRPWRSVWFSDPGLQRIINRLTATGDFDLILTEDNAVANLHLPAGTPAVLTEHEVLRPRPVHWGKDGSSNLVRHALNEIDWRRRPRFQRQAWRRFDRVIVFTKRDAESIAELAPEATPKLRVSPFGLIMPPPADPACEVEGVLLFVGNFHHQPNVDAAAWLALEILPRIAATHGSARLRIVGTDPPPEISSLAGPNVEIVAGAPSLDPHLDAASVVLAPVRTGGGMRMKVLQALASGKATVTTPRGLEGFDVFEPPPLRVAEDAAGLAEAVSGLLDDRAERHALGREGRAFAQRHYSPPAWARRLEEIYGEAVEVRKAAATSGGA